MENALQDLGGRDHKPAKPPPDPSLPWFGQTAAGSSSSTGATVGHLLPQTGGHATRAMGVRPGLVGEGSTPVEVTSGPGLVYNEAVSIVHEPVVGAGPSGTHALPPCPDLDAAALPRPGHQEAERRADGRAQQEAQRQEDGRAQR